MPKISVIIPVYNTEKYLKDCLDSVIHQTFSDIEIICIDDGSTDKSINILRQYEKQDHRIKIISQPNLGVVAARNTGIKNATGKFIYPLDSDDVINSKTLEILYDALINNKGNVITSRILTFGRHCGEMSLPEPNKINMAFKNCLVNAALFPKSLFDLSGGFDEHFQLGLEDYDFWLNLLYRHNCRFYDTCMYRIKSKTGCNGGQ